MNDYGLLASAAAKKYGLPDGLLEAVITAESNWNPKARSPAGALGIAQIMPPTAKDLGIDPLDPVQAIDGAARHLARLNKKFGNLDNTIAAYNAGEGNVQKYGGIPPFKETQNYVPKVKANMSKPEIDLSTVKWDDEQIDLASVKWDGEPAKSVEPNPTDGNSFLENVIAGVGGRMVGLGLGVKQRFDEGAAALEKKFGGQKLGAALGMPTAESVLSGTQNKIAEKRKIDIPLLATAGGKTGDLVTAALPAFGAAMLPGGQALTGSMIAGAGLGYAEPTTEGESVSKNIALGAGGGAAGFGAGKLIQAGANKVLNKNAANAAQNIMRDTAAAEAKASGYVIPPVQTNPTFKNRMLEGLAGKLSTAQSASVKNQPIHNQLAAKSLGLDPAEPITKELLVGVRSTAGQAYEKIKAVGTLSADAQYARSLGGITQKYKGASKDFPELAKNEIDDIVSSINKPEFGADSAIDAISILRERATAAYSKNDKTVGRAYKEAAEAMEDLIERNLKATQNHGLLKSFRDARQLIAKSYSVEGALNESTGNIIAGKLANQLKRGKPLSAELKQIAKFSQAFPTAAKEVTSSMPGVSPLDFAAGGMMSASHGNIMPLIASLGTRPLARAGLLSKAYQNTGGAANYNAPVAGLLGRNQTRLGVQGFGAGALPQLFEEQNP